MSLKWDATEVETGTEVRGEDGAFLAPAELESFVWTTMGVFLNEITDDTVDEFAIRMAVQGVVQGARSYPSRDGWTAAQFKERLLLYRGLKTNASVRSRTAWFRGLAQENKWVSPVARLQLLVDDINSQVADLRQMIKDHEALLDLHDPQLSEWCGNSMREELKWMAEAARPVLRALQNDPSLEAWSRALSVLAQTPHDFILQLEYEKEEDEEEETEEEE
jgi:hypothetical protein